MNDLTDKLDALGRAYFEAERMRDAAEEALDNAKAALKPLIIQQIDITKRLVKEFDFMAPSRGFRPFFYYDWFEIELGNENGAPIIECVLWYRGSGGDSNTEEGSFKLSHHIINGEPEKFEAELRVEFQRQAAERSRREQARIEAQIAELQASLARLQGNTEKTDKL